MNIRTLGSWYLSIFSLGERTLKNVQTGMNKEREIYSSCRDDAVGHPSGYPNSISLISLNLNSGEC